MAGCCCRVLLPHLSPVVIDGIDCIDGTVVIATHPRARGSRCRRCGRVSTRVHSRVRRGDKWRGFAELNGGVVQRQKVYVQVTELCLLAKALRAASIRPEGPAKARQINPRFTTNRAACR